MDRETRRHLEEYRRSEAGSIESNLIDELVAGELDRAEFIRRGMIFGLGASVIGVALRAVGEAPLAHAATQAAKKGGTLRIAHLKPAKAVEPYLLADQGGLKVSGIVGEFLAYSRPDLTLAPVLATSWKPNADGSRWTFQIRKGVKFHNGRPLAADDVVATFKRLTAAPSSALSVFKGVLDPAGVRKGGSHTVVFDLEQAVASFPYLVSNTTYQAVILPRNYRPGQFERSSQGTGPYKLERYTSGRGVTFVRNAAYWGGMPALDRVVVTFYETTAPQILALQAGQVDIVPQVSFQEAAPLFRNAKVQILSSPSANHRQFCVRTDQEPWLDRRVRRAVALCLDRPGLIKSLFNGRSQLGNDSPFMPAYPSTDKKAAQRKQNIAQARALLDAAGKKDLEFTITTYQGFEIPDYAQIIQAACREAGITVKLNILSEGEYYAGDNSTTLWLNANANITDWGHRSVPNVFLTSAYTTGGIWNASKYSSKLVDSAIKSFLAAVDVQTQRKYSGQIQRNLLADTPVITSYFYDYLAATSKKVKGYKASAISDIQLAAVSLA